MCKGAVAAPLPLQAIVYPIFRKKSLSFCENLSGKAKFFHETVFCKKLRGYACFFSSAVCSLPCFT